MELISLCGFVIVVFVLLVEFELTVKAAVKMIRNSGFIKANFSNAAVQHPVHMSRLPICLAKLPRYRESV
jgi:hypothetical protein